MRGASVVSAVVVAVALCLGASDLLAKAQPPIVIHSMTARPDLIQWQIAAWDWLRASMTSTSFLVGAGLGVVLAEVGRFVLRWALRAVGVATAAVNIVVRYRLLAVGIAAAIYYVAAYHVMA